MRFCSACGEPLPARPPVTCGSCGAEHYRNAKPCAGALVTDDEGRVLLMFRDHEPWGQRWDIPGGFCEYDEHPADAARRELLEETGLEVEIGDLIGMWVDHYPVAGVPDDEVQTTLNIYFHARKVGGTERPQPGEATELRWFGPDEIPSDMAFPEQAVPALAAWKRERS